MRYKYLGQSEVEAPSKIGDTKLVKPQEVFESDKEINNPDFELLTEEEANINN